MFLLKYKDDYLGEQKIVRSSSNLKKNSHETQNTGEKKFSAKYSPDDPKFEFANTDDFWEDDLVLNSSLIGCDNNTFQQK